MLSAWGRNSRKGRKKRRKTAASGSVWSYQKTGYYDRRTSHYAGNYERGEYREARRAFHEYLHAHFSDVPGIERFVTGRYHLVYVSHHPNYATDGERWGFLLVPKGGRYEIHGTGRFTPHYGTHANDVWKVFPLPPNASRRIGRARPLRQNVALAYRGMCFEEFQGSLSRGWFASLGSFNIPGQGETVTFFSKEPGTAAMYAESFQAWPFHATFTRPGVIVAVPRDILENYYGVGLSPEQREVVKRTIRNNPHVNEMVYWGKLPFETVRAAWYSTPIRMKAGYVEARHTPGGGWGEGSRNSPSADYAYFPVPEFDTGLAGLRRVR